MPRTSKKKDAESNDGNLLTRTPEDEAEQKKSLPNAESAGPFVTVLKTANASKLSPRGEGDIIYMVGELDEKVYVRIADNNSGGRHSKEWLPADAIREAFTPSMLAGNAFKSNSFAKSFRGQSNNNSGFLVAILRKEGLFVADVNKPHLTKLVSSEALNAWEKDVLNMPRPQGAERLPLHPPKPNHLFKKGENSAAQEEKSVPSDNEAA